MRKYFLIAVIFCIIGFIGCTDGSEFIDRIYEIDPYKQSQILGKWQLIGIFYVNDYGNGYYTNDVDKEMFIEFKKDGNYISNVYPENLNYKINKKGTVYFYNNTDHFFDFICGIQSNLLILDSKKGGWFENDTLYKCHYYFTKMEAE